jgi:type I restriction-modification system DNA methylase subunit
MRKWKTDFRHDETKELHKLLSSLTSKGHNMARVFEDFLSAVVCSFSTGQLEDRYMEIAGRYGSEMNVLAQALGAVVVGMEKTEADILGDFFEGAITHGENGQFFTPEPLCELMARMTLGENPPEREDGEPLRICDPACGSGRTLLAAGRLAPDAVLYGTDIDHRCVMMTTINFALNYRRAHVVWGDALSLKEHGHYSVFRFGGLVQVLWGTAPILTVRMREQIEAAKPVEKTTGKQITLFDAA